MEFVKQIKIETENCLREILMPKLFAFVCTKDLSLSLNQQIIVLLSRIKASDTFIPKQMKIADEFNF